MRVTISFCILLLLMACQADQRIPTPTNKSVVSSEETQKASHQFPIRIQLDSSILKGDTSIQIPYDLFHKKEKRYRAYSLQQSLQAHLDQLKDQEDLQVVFVCKDGYSPSLPLSTVLQYDGYIAYRDPSLPIDTNWPDSIRQKFSPYYLSWTIPKELAYEVTWPYGLTHIELDLFDNLYGDVVPKLAEAQAGFKLYKKYCLKCHSINKIGGKMGPEMNYPKNITEYWKKEDIWQFIKAPQSYRFNSKMPPNPQISPSEFEEIYRYLVVMKDQKITPQ